MEQKESKFWKPFVITISLIIILAFLGFANMAIHFDDDKRCWQEGGVWDHKTDKCDFVVKNY